MIVHSDQWINGGERVGARWTTRANLNNQTFHPCSPRRANLRAIRTEGMNRNPLLQQTTNGFRGVGSVHNSRQRARAAATTNRGVSVKEPRCNRCDAPIVWGETPRHQWVALDATPVPTGPWILIPVGGGTALLSMDDERVAAIVATDPERVRPHRYVRHSTTCQLRGVRPVGEVIGRVVRP